MLNYFLVAVGGALGSVARFGLSGLVARSGHGSFPLGTILVNVSGSFIIGFFAAVTGPGGRWPTSPALRTFFMTGVLGGYTTFSAFSLQTLDLAREGQWLYAGLNVALSVGLCLAGVGLGHGLALALGLNARD